MSAQPVVSVTGMPQAKSTSTAPPATEDIDSEWPEEPHASEPLTGSLALATDDVDSGWLTDGDPVEEPRAAQAARKFPSDPSLPNELWGAVGAESRRAGSQPPAAAAPVSAPAVAVAAEPEPPQVPARIASADVAADSRSTSAKERPADVAAASGGEESARASMPPSPAPPRARGRTVLVAVALVAAAGLWFARGASRGSEEPGVQASRSEPAKVEAAHDLAPPPAPVPAAEPEPAVSAASPVGVEPPSAGAPIQPAPAPVEPTPAPSASVEAAAPAASVDPSSGKVVVILNVRPPYARIFYRGKEAGKAPLRVELEPGKRRSFEVGYPGFMTRKIVVDGSKAELLVGLRPASPYATGAAPAPAEN